MSRSYSAMPQKGLILYENDNGRLEKTSGSDGKGTFIGWRTLMPEGIVDMKKFRGSKEDVKERWLEWQREGKKRNGEKKVNTQQVVKPPVDGTVALASLVKSIVDNTKAVEDVRDAVMLLNETLASVKAVASCGPAEPGRASDMTVDDAIDEFIGTTAWFEFVNCTTTNVYNRFKKWVGEKGYTLEEATPRSTKIKLNRVIKSRFSELDIDRSDHKATKFVPSRKVGQ